MPRIIGYARVSSAEQALGTSLRDQQDSIRREAASRSLEVHRIYVEAESAVHEKIEQRVQMLALMADVRSGDLVLCDKLDRWSRDPEFTYGSVRKILAAGAHFYAIADRCDPSTSEGDTVLGFRILFAREEHKRIKERLVGTRRIIRDQGYYVEGTPPLGYRRSKPKGSKGLDKNILVVIPEEAELVRKIFHMYVSGWSMTKLANHLELKLNRVKDALHRRIYIGEVQNTKGEWIKGRHEAIIESTIFLRVHETIRTRTLGGPRPRDAISETSNWILRDVAYCAGCGGKMKAVYAGPKGPTRRYYYTCSKHCRSTGNRSNNGSCLSLRTVEDQMDPMIRARLVELRTQIAAGPQPQTEQKPPTKSREKLLLKRGRILEQYQEGDITRERYKKALSSVDVELLRLETPDAPLADPKTRRAALADLDTMEKAWRRAPPKLRRKIVGILTKKVLIGPGVPPEPIWETAESLAL